ncbi:glucosyl transferase [Vreelandella venusta]|nr:glucosyl transferase [Halomonas hydrothermalis]
MPSSTSLGPLIPWLNARRTLLATLVIGTSVVGCMVMANVVANLALGWRIVMLVLFGLTFSWIALAFWGAVCGFILCSLRLDPLTLKRQSHRPAMDALSSKTALIMPIYAEPPIPTLAGLEATCRSLLQEMSSNPHYAATPLQAHFEVFILSDTQQADQAAEEAAHVAALQQRLAGQVAVHYRRRPDNRGRKAGNIAEFCRRWGRRYDYMIVLDADSLMSGTTLLHLVHQMQRYAGVGLIQTVPLPVGQRTLFGRFIQFASALYSPMLAAGQSFWQGDAANYWGHNAIIRTHAFMAHAGLPTLPGKPPLGGELLSHDFVEAALLKRGGWQVLLDTSATASAASPLPLAGNHSLEAMPSNLLDFAKRDRRWLQGNLQHLRLLTGAGFHPISRLHFLFGAFAYLSSLVWLGLLLCTSFMVGYQAIDNGAPPLLPHSLSLGLLSVTLGMLLAPKVLGLVLALWQAPRAFNGRLALIASTLLEMLFAALIAPLMMAWHSLFIINVLIGRAIDWQTQHRGERSLSWRESWRHTGWMTLCGSLWAGLMILFSPSAFGWLTPAWLGLVAAAPLVKYSSSGTWGGVASQRLGLLHIPTGCPTPPLLQDFADLCARHSQSLIVSGSATPNQPPREQFGDMPSQPLKALSSRRNAASRAKEPH